MKKRNVTLKSMLRQPMRTLLLVVLMALGAFAFVLRTVEYIVVRNQILEIADTYHTVGFIQPEDGVHMDISPVVDLLWESGFLATEDRRQVFEGILQGMHNMDTMGMWRGVADDAEQLRISDAYFYATITYILTPDQPEFMHWLDLRVDYVYAGYEEMAIAGQQLWLGYNPYVYGWDIFEDFEIGERFFFRGRFFTNFGIDGAPHFPQRRQRDTLNMMPLNEEAGLWFLDKPGGERADFTHPHLSHLPDVFDFLSHHQSAMQIVATRDLTTASEFIGANASVRPARGRPIDLDDYLEGNHVVYVDTRFARGRNISVGDTIQIALHPHQYVDGVLPGLNMPFARSTPSDNPYMLELEVVGTFAYFGPIPLVSFGGTFAYVPASIIPEGFALSPPIREDIGIDWREGYLPAAWHSFTIADPTQEQEFLLWSRDNEQLLGYNIIIIGDGSDALNFWASADPVLLTILFNAVVFWAVVLLVLGLVSFIFVRQRQRDFSIYRAIGVGRGSVLLHTVKSLLFLGIPAIALGTLGGWYVARIAAATALEPFATFLQEEVFLHPILRPPPPQIIEFDVGIGFYWIVGMATAVFLVLLVMVIIIALRILNAPVLVLLQGGSTKKIRIPKNNKKHEQTPVDAPITTVFKEFSLPDKPLPVSNGAKLPNALSWVGRHMRRSLVKSLLGLMVALFFVISIGWLQEAVVRNLAEVDRLYDTTIVRGRIGTNLPGHETSPPMGMGNLFAPGFLGDVIRPQTAARVLAQEEWLNNIYVESAFLRSFFIPTPDGGGLPENWREASGIDPDWGIWGNMWNFDRLLAFNDIDFFVEENTDHLGQIEFEFAEGFSKDDFRNFQLGDRIPVIASYWALNRTGLELGDYINIGYFSISIGTMGYMPAQIIGTHNNHFTRDGVQENGVSLLPLPPLADALGSWLGYTVVAFDVDTAQNREVAYVREYLEGVVRTVGFHNTQLHLFLLDEELRNITTAVGQTVLLLELMYPIALIIAGAIALGLSMLLMLQSTKNAAIMRVLGGGKGRARSMLATELLIVCIGGLLIGTIWLLLAGWGFGVMEILTITAVYLGGALIGAIIGAIVVTRKSPLELLQVKE
ncbi:MAG: ABC transporter permease [Defluviitaleaceae bacterium]|nr:ABC transporter permease [Defluviitaleaceae bacterium]